MSGHSLGQQTSQKRLRAMVRQFSFGFIVMLWLMISTICLVLYFSFNNWLGSYWFWLGLVILLGIQVMTSLMLRVNSLRVTHPWLPKNLRKFLTSRATKTKSPAEAFSLGLVSPLVGSTATFLPLVVVGVSLLRAPNQWLVALIILFVLVSATPLLAFQFRVTKRSPVSETQRFIIKNQHFFQTIRLASLVLLIGLIAINLTLFGK